MMKSAYVRQCVKQSVKSASPVDEIAGAAKKLVNFGHKAGHGLKKPTVIVAGSSVDTQTFTPMYKHLVDIGALPHTISEAQYLKDPSKYKDYNVIAPSMRTGGKNKVGALPAELDNKFTESKLYGKFMPKTEAVGAKLSPDGQSFVHSDVHKALLDDKPLEAMDAKYGKGKWLLKSIGGFATKADQLLKADNIAGIIKHPDGGLEFSMKNGTKQVFQPKDLMMQELKDIRAPSYYRTADKVLKAVLPKKITDKLGALSRDTQEFRVHLLNGKVVPEGTVGRGTMSQHIMSGLTPIRSPDMRKAEELATQVAKSMTADRQRGFYGLDVGIDRKTGKAFLIETNPATDKGLSGFLDTPQGSDAVASAYNNKMPALKKIKLGLLGTAGLGGLGLGAYELGKDKQPEPQPESGMAATIMSRVKRYIPQA